MKQFEVSYNDFTEKRTASDIVTLANEIIAFYLEAHDEIVTMYIVDDFTIVLIDEDNEDFCTICELA